MTTPDAKRVAIPCLTAHQDANLLRAAVSTSQMLEGGTDSGLENFLQTVLPRALTKKSGENSTVKTNVNPTARNSFASIPSNAQSIEPLRPYYSTRSRPKFHHANHLRVRSFRRRVDCPTPVCANKFPIFSGKSEVGGRALVGKIHCRLLQAVGGASIEHQKQTPKKSKARIPTLQGHLSAQRPEAALASI